MLDAHTAGANEIRVYANDTDDRPVFALAIPGYITERDSVAVTLVVVPRPAPAESELDVLFRLARERFEAMTPAEQEAMLATQRESWARGEAAMGSDADEARNRRLALGFAG